MSTMTTESIRKTVLVDFAPARRSSSSRRAFSSWWPDGTHPTAHDKVTDVIFDPRVGGLLYEVTDEANTEVGSGSTAGSRRIASRLEWLIGKVLRHRGRSALLPGGTGIASGARTSRLGTCPGRDR